MPQKKSAAAAALDTLYQQNPKVFKEFISAVTEDLGVIPAGTKGAYEVLCPHCSTPMVLSLQRATGQQLRRISKGTTFGLILQLAKLRGVMVGVINSDFTKRIGGPKVAKTLTKEQYRSRKEKWLKQEIAKARR